MLYVGTSNHLEEIDSSLTLAADASVTAIAGRGDSAWVLLDRERIAEIGDLDVRPIAEISGAAQSIGVTRDSGLLVGLQGGHLCLLDETGHSAPIESFDRVAGRDEWENPAGPVPDLRSIAIGQQDEWYANVHVGGVWRSTDQGRTWTGVIEPESDVHEVATGEGGIVCVAAAKGFGWSADSGATWTWMTDGLHAPYARAVAVSGDTVYVSASTGPRTSDGRLYRASIGSSFEACNRGIPESFPFNIDTGTLAASGESVAFGTQSGDFYRSSDSGNSWEKVASEMRPVTFVRFA